MQALAQWLPLTAAVELIRPLFLGQWPAHALQHLLVLLAYGVAGFWLALALTRKRFKG
jgi:lipooligosaccharide transport system permease protein